MARALLVESLPRLNALVSSRWWAARCLFIQQQLLDNGTATLHDAILEHMRSLESALPILTDKQDAEQRDLVIDVQSRYWLEQGLVLQWYREDNRAVEYFKKAQAVTGLRWELTGALGKRTRFQVSDKSQLVVLAESANLSSDANDAENNKKNMPNTLLLNDDTILEDIKFAPTNPKEGELDPNTQRNLRVIDQCILLAFCLNVKNTNPDHGLTTEEMQAYVRRVLQHPNNWMVHTMGLLLRSRLEANKSRTVERSVFQLQALVDQIPLDESTATERLAYIYDILLPSKWAMEKELAERFISLGVVRSAMEIFERLEMWEDVISCHIMLEENRKALAVVERELEKSPNSPKLICILGDLTSDPKQYERAWEVSGKRYARAMRSLGGYHFKREAWRESLDCYLRALAINPLFENTWFIAGCAALHLEDWEEAENAFRRVVALNEENGEAWNNQATVLLKLQRKTEALRALKQAVRYKFDSWRIWTNYMYTAMDLGEYQQAMHAMQRVVELRADKDPNDCVDVEILEMLVTTVTRTAAEDDEAKQYVERLATRLEQLLKDCITARITNNARIWKSCARFYFWRCDYALCLDAHIKAYRAMLHSGSHETDSAAFETLVDAAIELVDMYRNLGPRTITVTPEDGGAPVKRQVAEDWRFQARSLLRSLIGRTREAYADTPAHDRLIEALNELKRDD
jgi:tetratricopeptide (TPR) repeat protein